MNKQSCNKMSGFTMIELISVIVILGVLAVGISSFLKFGTQIYAETTARDQIISSARFTVERLNREVRHALPNSLRTYVNASGYSCLQFTPIIASTTYMDLPVSPEPGSLTLEVIPFNDNNFNQVIVEYTIKAVVYPLDVVDLADASDKNHEISSLDKSTVPWVLTFGSPIHFESYAPSERIYFISGNVDYCLVGTTLTRKHTHDVDDILMAQNLMNNSSFLVDLDGLKRYALVQINLTFEKNFEQITFNNEVQVFNVP